MLNLSITLWRKKKANINYLAFCEGEKQAIHIIAKFWEGWKQSLEERLITTEHSKFDLKTEHVSNKIQKVFGNMDLESKSKFWLRNHSAW